MTGRSAVCATLGRWCAHTRTHTCVRALSRRCGARSAPGRTGLMPAFPSSRPIGRPQVALLPPSPLAEGAPGRSVPTNGQARRVPSERRRRLLIGRRSGRARGGGRHHVGELAAAPAGLWSGAAGRGERGAGRRRGAAGDGRRAGPLRVCPRGSAGRRHLRAGTPLPGAPRSSAERLRPGSPQGARGEEEEPLGPLRPLGSGARRG